MACSEPIAAAAGTDVLKMGGSVVEAVIAASYVQAVVSPLACGLAGKASIHLKLARSDSGVVLDAAQTVGSAASPEVFRDDYRGRLEAGGPFRVRGDRNTTGYEAITTPGFVPGTAELHRRGEATMSWSNLLTPAIVLANEGFTIDAPLSAYWRCRGVGGTSVQDRLLCNDAAREIFLKSNGDRYQEGDYLRQDDLGQTLIAIAQDGPEIFYKGSLARLLASDLTRHHAFVTYDDMAGFEVECKPPLRTVFQDYVVESNALPGNGIVLLQILRILDGWDLSRFGHNSSQYVKMVSGAMCWAFSDRAMYRGDPRERSVPVEMLLSEQRAREHRHNIEHGVMPHETIDIPSDSGTTHVVGLDTAGNVVSMTHSIGSPGGACVVTPGTGVLHNNHMAMLDPRPGSVDSIRPGRRGGGSCPTIVYASGEPVVAIGGAGGTRQVTATAQVLVNLLTFGMDWQAAVAAPRFHCEQAGRILAEAGLIHDGSEYPRVQIGTSGLGRVAGASRDPESGALAGAADSRHVTAVG